MYVGHPGSLISARGILDNAENRQKRGHSLVQIDLAGAATGHHSVTNSFPFPTLMNLASPNESQITLLLRRWAAGEAEAPDELLSILYEPLRNIARQR